MCTGRDDKRCKVIEVLTTSNISMLRQNMIGVVLFSSMSVTLDVVRMIVREVVP